MKVLVIGQGAREHALAKQLQKSATVSEVYCAPGHAAMGNDGIHCVPIEVTQLEELKDFALDKKIGLTVVGPEKPLIEGIVDLFRENDLKIFGPTKAAAQLEGSKSFAKQIMKKFTIPTASYEVFNNFEEAKRGLAHFTFPLVVKYDGLASGKGVIIAQNETEGLEALEQFYSQEHQETVVIEEFMEGYEFSYHCLIHKEQILPLISSQDYKRSGDGNTGKNTGGMGAFAPVPFASDSMLDEITQTIVQPLVDGLKQEGTSYSGVLYVGIMWTQTGPKVIEFNVRFGDPETQVILPLLKTDFVQVLLNVLDEEIPSLEWDSEQVSVGVVLAAKGYPNSCFVKDYFPSYSCSNEEQKVFYAQVIQDKGEYINEGGRVLTVQQLAPSYEKARENIYAGLRKYEGDSFFYRQDIAQNIEK